MGLWISIRMDPQLNILILLVLIALTHIHWHVSVILPLLPCFILLSTVKQKICCKTGTLCAENCDWSDSMWLCCLERAAWVNSLLWGGYTRSHGARTSTLPSSCGIKPLALHAAIPSQRHRNQSSWYDRVRQVPLDRPIQPKWYRKMWRICRNYKGKRWEAILYLIFKGVSFRSKWHFWKCYSRRQT